MRAVLDTNIFVSGAHWPGSSAKILHAWMEERFKHVSSIPIVDEIIRVLMGFKRPMDPANISWWERLILET